MHPQSTGPPEYLSGGEKSRLTVAKLLFEKSNFLVLDEPTNHLDMKAKDVLQQAVARFDGTVLVVSHDRFFLDRVVDRVIRLKDGKLSDYRGNYTFYLSQIEVSEEEAPSKEPSGEKSKKKEDRRKATEEKIRRGRVLRERQAFVERLEMEITALETRLRSIEEGVLAGICG